MKPEGKSALTTSSGRNQGRAIAIRFAQEGADLIINARENKGELEATAEAAPNSCHHVASQVRRGRLDQIARKGTHDIRHPGQPPPPERH